MQGMTLKMNKNGFIIAWLHYTADSVKRTKEWYKKIRPGYSEAAWKKEYEIDFEVLSGTLVYPEFNENIHLVSRYLIDKRRLNTEGVRYRILDHGATNPTACIWVWVDRDDNWIVYREYYVSNQTVAFHAPNIKKLSQREQYEEFIADPSIWAKNQEKNGVRYSIAERYAEYGIDLVKGNNDFQSGSDIIKERLRIDPDRVNPFTGEKGAPGIYFVREECNFTIWEIKKWRYQEFSSLKLTIKKNPKEQPVDKDNHIMDCLTYFANHSIVTPVFEESSKSIIQKDIEKILNKQIIQDLELQDQFNQNII